MEVQTEKMMICLPTEKVLPTVGFTYIFELGKKYIKRTTLKELQSLIGTLNFACKVVRPGRTFLRLIYLMHGSFRPFHHVRLTESAKLDMNVWLSLLQWYFYDYV